MQLPAQFRKRTRPKSNPAWVDRALTKHWDALEAAVGAELLPREKHGVMEELGCGAYGCVLPTFSEGVVLKITTDASEAHFAAAAMQLVVQDGWWPPGIVEYYNALALSEKYQSADVYLLWREEAHHVGLLAAPDPTESQVMRVAFGGAPDFPSPKRYLQHWDSKQVSDFTSSLYAFLLLSNEVMDGMDDARQQGYDMAVVLSDFPAGYERELMTKLQRAADHIAALDVGSSVGVALRYYLDKGLLLADVHPGNIGEVGDPGDEDDWDFAITDPGHMVPLEPGWLSVELPLIA